MATIGVFASIFDRDRRALCVRQNYGERLWTTPGGRLEPRNDGGSRRHAERAAHEIEILHGGGDVEAEEFANGDQHRVFHPGLGAGVAQPVDIALLVPELQRIGRHRR